MLKKIISTFIALLPMYAFANWSYVDKIDDFTDKAAKYTAYSDDNHRVQLSRENSAVWIFITRKSLGTFEPNGLIEIRVDKNKMRETDPKKLKKLAKLLGRSTFQWEPATVGFLVWHGTEKKGDDCGFISELLSGQELKIRYQINTLERNAFTVSLQGSKDAIIKGLGLNICGIL